MTFLSYRINFRGSGGPEKTLRIKLNIWSNTKSISVPFPKKKNYGNSFSSLDDVRLLYYYIYFVIS